MIVKASDRDVISASQWRLAERMRKRKGDFFPGGDGT